MPSADRFSETHLLGRRQQQHPASRAWHLAAAVSLPQLLGLVPASEVLPLLATKPAELPGGRWASPCLRSLPLARGMLCSRFRRSRHHDLAAFIAPIA